MPDVNWPDMLPRRRKAWYRRNKTVIYIGRHRKLSVMGLRGWLAFKFFRVAGFLDPAYNVYIDDGNTRRKGCW